jgi:hypothetical protein
MYMEQIVDGKNRVVVTLVPPLQLPTMWENCGQKSGGRGEKANADAVPADGLLDDFWNCYVVDLLLSLQSVSCSTISSLLFFSFVSYISIMSSTQVQASVLHGAKDLRIVSPHHSTPFDMNRQTKT